MMKKLLAIALLLATSFAQAQTYNLFQPANGILKGQTSTYVTTPAGSTDVRSLWSGTCNSTTYLRGDGSCQTPPGAGGGSVNSVALTAPSIFSVAGSPITNTGTLALTFDTGQTQNLFLATPNGSTGAAALRSIVLADLPTVTVAKGGTGATTLTGPLKGNGTSAFTAAASADIYGLWSGTCSASTFLRGDGSCQTPTAGTGTVTSVALTVPSGFSVGGSPITTSGTLAITGTLNPAAGGTGVATITGPIKGNGTSAFSAAVSADISGLWGGTCNGTTYLRGDGSCQTPPTGGTSANPSATIGLTAVNGSAGTFLRSDGAPALSQAIAPTWTATHTFSPSSGAAITANGVAGSYTALVNASATSSQSFGLAVTAGTNSSDIALHVRNASSTADFLRIIGSGNATFGNATGNPSFTFAGTGGDYHGGAIFGADGTFASPSYSFTSDIDTGMYSAGANTIGFSTGGAARLVLTSTGTYLRTIFGAPDGAAATPSYSFENDLDTGAYRITSNTYGIATNGVRTVSVAPSGLQIDLGALFAQDGTAASPSIAFANDTDTGVYHVNTNIVGLAGGGVRGFSVGTGVAYMEDGTVGAPGLSFIGNNDTGLYRIGGNNLGVAVAGSKVLDVTTSVFNITSTAAQVNGTSIRDGGILTSGTVADARLSVNVPLKNGTNTFSAANTFTSSLIAKDTTGSGSAMTAYLSLQDATSTERGWVGFGAGTTAFGVTNNIGVINLAGTAVNVNGTSVNSAAVLTSGTVATARLGSGTANSTTFLRGDNTWATPGGAAIGHAAFGRFTVGSSTCTLAGGAGVSSCTYNGAGNVTVGFSSTAGTGGWICTATSATNGNPSVMRASGASTSAINIYAYLSGTLTDTDFTMTCMAN